MFYRFGSVWLTLCGCNFNDSRVMSLVGVVEPVCGMPSMIVSKCCLWRPRIMWNNASDFCSLRSLSLELWGTGRWFLCSDHVSAFLFVFFFLFFFFSFVVSFSLFSLFLSLRLYLFLLPLLLSLLLPQFFLPLLHCLRIRLLLPLLYIFLFYLSFVSLPFFWLRRCLVVVVDFCSSCFSSSQSVSLVIIYYILPLLCRLLLPLVFFFRFHFLHFCPLFYVVAAVFVNFFLISQAKCLNKLIYNLFIIHAWLFSLLCVLKCF